MYTYAAVGLVIVFLASVARFYHPGFGFTALIGFRHDSSATLSTLRETPHFQFPRGESYDGQYYAQLALDPLLRDPGIDRALDLAPFRARRILFSWTAWALGLGRPAWILNVYALQNVAAWLLLALLLARWIPPTSARGLALWTACLFSHGMLWSVRFSLLDGPSLLLIACAIAAAERGRALGSVAIVGVAGLARETNLLALAAQPPPGSRRAWLRLLVGGVVAIAPIVIWYDYLWSIYRSTLLTGAGSFDWPGSGMAAAWIRVLGGISRHGMSMGDAMHLCLMLALPVQAVYLLLRRNPSSAWWRVAIGYAALMTLLNPELSHPLTGALTRVLLALTVGFNVQLARESKPVAFWSWYAAGNLHLIVSPRVMPLF